MTAINILVLLAHKFEEVEVVTPCDILERAGAKIHTASIGCEERIAVSSHKLWKIQADHCLISDKDKIMSTKYDVILLPGGAGAETLAESPIVKEVIAKQIKEKRWVAAICAAPALILKGQGHLDNGAKVVCYPLLVDQLGDSAEKSGKTTYTDTAHKIISSSGPGTAVEFALQIVSALLGKPKADEIAKSIVYNHPYC